jgi:hypothetical protein
MQNININISPNRDDWAMNKVKHWGKKTYANWDKIRTEVRTIRKVFQLKAGKINNSFDLKSEKFDMENILADNDVFIPYKQRIGFAKKGAGEALENQTIFYHPSKTEFAHTSSTNVAQYKALEVLYKSKAALIVGGTNVFAEQSLAPFRATPTDLVDGTPHYAKDGFVDLVEIPRLNGNATLAYKIEAAAGDTANIAGAEGEETYIVIEWVGVVIIDGAKAITSLDVGTI